MRDRSIPRVRQHDATDCGAACLDSVARFYGRRFPISRIRQLAGTDKRGTSVRGMIEAAQQIGLMARGVRGTFQHLATLPTPAIIHLLLDGARPHFVVLYSFTPRSAVVMDPADGGVHRLSHAAFRTQWTGVAILLAPADEFSGARQEPRPLVRLWQLARPHRAAMAQALIGAVAYTLLGLSTAIYVQKIVDFVIVDGNRNLLNLMSVVMLALIALQAYIGGSKNLLALRTGQRIDASLILAYHHHLLRLPQRFFDTMRVGEIVSRVGDAVKIRAFINNTSLDLVVNLLVVVFSFALMLLYSWRLALVMAVALPLYGAVFFLLNRSNRLNQRRLMERAAELESQLIETVSSMGTIKRLGLEESAQLRTETRLVRLLRPVYRSGVHSLSAGGATDLVSRLCTVALLWVGAGLVLRQTLSPGELMSFYALVGHLTGPVTGLISANQAVQDALIAADRLFEIMDLDTEDSPDDGVKREHLPPGNLVFREVTFRYDSHTRVFQGLSLEIARGQVTAIVGESGSGKSTLAALLHRLYPLESGSILFGEREIRYLHRETLRRRIGVVPQRVELFSGSVLENIAAGDPQPDLDRVLGICEQLGIKEFVERLPMGFRTPLGDHGANLSGGQRQRIAIARALYREPEVLVLDEATAALDSVSEQLVQRTLRHLRAEGRTLVVIAHRLSTVATADKIVVLEGGRVAEFGTHAELMRREGRYFRLWRHQLGAISPIGEVARMPVLLESLGSSASGPGAAQPTGAPRPA